MSDDVTPTKNATGGDSRKLMTGSRKKMTRYQSIKLQSGAGASSKNLIAGFLNNIKGKIEEKKLEQSRQDCTDS
jgi:hypothetical protein